MSIADLVSMMGGEKEEVPEEGKARGYFLPFRLRK
jgi:hypothetical protein